MGQICSVLQFLTQGMFSQLLLHPDPTVGHLQGPGDLSRWGPHRVMATTVLTPRLGPGGHRIRG